ncbi:hypothetical protein OCU04_013179 [Sclerotinia nivalis]|uniref:Uncharacterized protein n=1 Tax=Sclerotinia nivalis TaxID=352851 RepID=A0A9X0DC65_9HELO|nr:hypothetical protein OCU04_013179 [Sclerotinia nivalis]
METSESDHVFSDPPVDGSIPKDVNAWFVRSTETKLWVFLHDYFTFLSSKFLPFSLSLSQQYSKHYAVAIIFPHTIYYPNSHLLHISEFSPGSLLKNDPFP